MNVQTYLAQINIGKILGPMDGPIMAEFANGLDSINELAEGSPGFVWRLKDDSNNATSIKFFDDDFMIVNMSVWKDMNSLHAFVYKTVHADYLKQRKKWFERLSDMHMALWHIPSSGLPTVKDAIERLYYLRNHGETPFAFSFRNAFTSEEALNYNPSF